MSTQPTNSPFDPQKALLARELIKLQGQSGKLTLLTQDERKTIQIAARHFSCEQKEESLTKQLTTQLRTISSRLKTEEVFWVRLSNKFNAIRVLFLKCLGGYIQSSALAWQVNQSVSKVEQPIQNFAHNEDLVEELEDAAHLASKRGYNKNACTEYETTLKKMNFKEELVLEHKIRILQTALVGTAYLYPDERIAIRKTLRDLRSKQEAGDAQLSHLTSWDRLANKYARILSPTETDTTSAQSEEFEREAQRLEFEFRCLQHLAEHCPQLGISEKITPAGLQETLTPQIKTSIATLCAKAKKNEVVDTTHMRKQILFLQTISAPLTETLTKCLHTLNAIDREKPLREINTLIVSINTSFKSLAKQLRQGNAVDTTLLRQQIQVLATRLNECQRISKKTEKETDQIQQVRNEHIEILRTLDAVDEKSEDILLAPLISIREKFITLCQDHDQNKTVHTEPLREHVRKLQNLAIGTTDKAREIRKGCELILKDLDVIDRTQRNRKIQLRIEEITNSLASVRQKGNRKQTPNVQPVVKEIYTLLNILKNLPEIDETVEAMYNHYSQILKELQPTAMPTELPQPQSACLTPDGSTPGHSSPSVTPTGNGSDPDLVAHIGSLNA